VLAGQCGLLFNARWQDYLEWFTPESIPPAFPPPACRMKANPESSSRSASLAWWISLLLLLATMLNYMDRQTLANVSVRITREFELNEEQYGSLETAFGVAFAVGSLVFGMLADRLSIRWLYPAVLTAWSVVGFVTGLTSGYDAMLVCRTLLGFFEAGHWPCALAVTHAVLTRSDRTLGNSILQSGASLGAILTPLIIRALVGTSDVAGLWRSPFLVIGAMGLFWVAAWVMIVRPETLPRTKPTGGGAPAVPFRWLVDFATNPRFWSLVVMVISINATWQLIRAWLPKFLQQGRGYSEAESLYFNSAYYLSTDVGCILAGAATLWLARRGMTAHRSRLLVYGVCACVTSLTVVAASLPQGWLLLALLLVIGAGALGMFPCFYSMVQEVDARYVGKATGLLGFVAWAASSPLHREFGKLVDQTGSFDQGLAIIGCVPMAGLFAVLCFWRSPVLPTASEAEPAKSEHIEISGGTQLADRGD
jgi:ACS family hexuronate transporter-like MFS transporter